MFYRFTLILVGLAMFVAACSPSSPLPSETAQPPEVGLSVSPERVTLAPGETQELRATVSGAPAEELVWTLDGEPLGQSGAAITFAAPDIPGTYQLTVTTKTDPPASAGAVISVAEPGQSLETAELTETGALTRSQASPAADFGAAVAVDGDTALVGSPGRYGDTDFPGLVEVYRKGADGGWQHAGTLAAPAAASTEQFGHAVALGGEVAAIASQDAVYIYRRDTDGGLQMQKVLFEGEGISVLSLALEGTTLAVGEGATPAVHIFEQDAGGENSWGLVQTISLADVGLDFAYHFGRDIDLGQDGAALIVSNSGSDDQYYRHASALIFERNQGDANRWGLAKTLTPPGGPDRDAWDNATYGWTVAIDGDTAVVASRPIQGGRSAEVFVYARDLGGSNNWGERARHVVSPFPAELQSQAGTTVEHSTTAVALKGDTVIAGAYAYACFNEQSYDTACAPGQVYVFERDQGGSDAWGVTQILQASNAQVNQHFGRSLALDGGTVLVGARDGADEAEADPGAFVFERR